MRSVLLACSQNAWLCDRVPRYWFARRAAARFMPGETLDDALLAAQALCGKGIESILSYLGENTPDPAQAEEVTDHYLGVLNRTHELNLPTELSLKLTQLGLALSLEDCYANLTRILDHADVDHMVWIDMEASQYVDATLDIYRRARQAYPNVGVCLQAYLFRTAADLETLIPLGAAIRLVKGAYKEPPDRAFPRKRDVEENFFALSKRLLGKDARRAGVRTAIATHDCRLIRRIEEFARSSGLSKQSLQFQMLYGVQRAEQVRLASQGWRSAVLISYGTCWFPWYVRRLAERPANVLFLLRCVVSD